MNFKKMPFYKRPEQISSTEPQIIKTIDIKKLCEAENFINNILEFKSNDKLTCSLKNAFLIWEQIPALQAENDMADIVLSTLYQRGKVKDYTDKILAFAERINKISSAETAIEMGYNNYIYFIHQFVNGMHAQKSDIHEAAPSGNIILFIQSECGTVESLKALFRAYTIISQLKQSMQTGSIKTQEIVKKISDYTECIELIANSKDYDEIDNVRQNLLQRVESMKRNISNGRQAYDKICRIMTTEWFEQFNPDSESCAVKGFTKEQLTDFYSEKMNYLKSELFADMN